MVKVGRYSERDNHPSNPDSSPDVLPVGFKSKVVSRRHCEFWCTNGQWFIKDVKSSSGTFLNHVRLSSPGSESRPFPVNDGDVVQLGIDFKGGEEVIFRCVKIRIECNRGWQKNLNAFNTSTHKRLLKQTLSKRSRDSDAQSVNSSECSICLNPVAPCQALFVAPCSHVWHYKCVRNLIHGPSWPNFLCPNCRFVADLEADVEPPEEEEEEELEATPGQPQLNGTQEEGAESGSSDDARAGASDGEGDDVHAQRLPSMERNSNITDDELNNLLQQTTLNSPSPSPRAPRSRSRHSRHDSPSRNLHLPEPKHPHSRGSSSQPLAIHQPIHHHQRTSSSDLLGAHPRSATPTSTAQFALAAGVIGDGGPMTPRNDAGPFVFDGMAGRSRNSRDGSEAGSP